MHDVGLVDEGCISFNIMICFIALFWDKSLYMYTKREKINKTCVKKTRIHKAQELVDKMHDANIV